MIWTIFVENFEIDPPQDFSSHFTYTIDDIRDFGARNTNFSKTIILPGTARNRKVFGHVFELSSANYTTAGTNIGYNYNASLPAKCVIMLDNIQVFKGIIRILEVIDDEHSIEIETAVFGELGGLVSAIGDAKLQDLDFSAYDHTYNVTNISNSWSALPGTGYYYPHIDYGYGGDGKFIPIENFRPAFYVREYLNKILTGAGYTWESTYFDTTFFKKLIIPFNGAYVGKEVNYALRMTDVSYTFDNGAMVYDTASFDTTVESYFTVGNSGVSAGNNKFTWDRLESASLKCVITGSFSWSAYAGGEVLFIRLVRNGLFPNRDIMVEGSYSGATGTINISEVVTVNPGDTLYVEVYTFVPAFVPAATVTITSFAFALAGQPSVFIAARSGETIEANNCIPKNVFQKDFLASIVKMFNLYIYEDRNRIKHLKIEPYVNFYTPSQRVDWGAKMDRSKPRRLKPMGELGSRIYEFKYKEDSDFYNELYKKKWGETYGSYVFDTGLELVKDKTTTEVIFSPTPSIQHYDRVVPAIFKESGGTRERVASNIRILIRCASNIACQTWRITNGGTGVLLSTFSTYAYAGHLDDPDAPTVDLNWGAPNEFFFTIVTGYLSANLFNVYWSFYMSEITDKDSKIMSAYFKLTPSDIYLLDFAKLYFIDGVLWRLNKVEDYSTDGSTTKCELLKVLDME